MLAGRAHLTPDQGLRLCRFWEMELRDTRAFLALLGLDRAGTRELQEFHRGELAHLRAESETLAKRYEQPDLPSAEQARYYSDWLHSAIHMLLTIPGLDRVAPLAEHLEIPEASVARILKSLRAIGFVTEAKGHWWVTSKVVHVSKDSPYNSLNHQNWRNRAVLDSALSTPRSVHYTAVYTMSRRDADRLRAMLLEFLDRTREIVAPSPEEEAICFNCDWFRI